MYHITLHIPQYVPLAGLGRERRREMVWVVDNGAWDTGAEEPTAGDPQPHARAGALKAF